MATRQGGMGGPAVGSAIANCWGNLKLTGTPTPVQLAAYSVLKDVPEIGTACMVYSGRVCVLLFVSGAAYMGHSTPAAILHSVFGFVSDSPSLYTL